MKKLLPVLLVSLQTLSAVARRVEVFGAYRSERTLQRRWGLQDTKPGKQVRLGVDGSNLFMVIRFNGPTEVANVSSGTDLSQYRVLGLKLRFPEITPDNYHDTEKLFVRLRDTSGNSVKVDYPFSNNPWLFDEREWVDWHINLLDVEDAGVDMQNVERISIGVSSGQGVINVDSLSFEAPDVVMDFTRVIRSQEITLPDANRDPNPGAYWGSTVLKVDGMYHMYTEYWDDGKKWYQGGIDYHSAGSLSAFGSPKQINNVMVAEDPTRWSTSDTWGDFAHNPDIFQDDDGTYYLYYLSGDVYNDNKLQNREVTVAWSSSPSGPWTKAAGPILTISEHGIPAYASHDGCTTYGVSNPRMIKKDGQYYLFHKVLCNFTYPDGVTSSNGSLGYYLYYTAAVSDSPTGPFRMQQINGLRGRSTNYEIYQETGMRKPGNWNLEDACFFEYRGTYYCIMKDFMGRWNRTDEEDGLVLWESADLLNWRVSDFPLVTRNVRELEFSDQLWSGRKLERPYVFVERDAFGEPMGTGAITFAKFGNFVIPLNFEDVD